jgi:hypothetical protein
MTLVYTDLPQKPTYGIWTHRSQRITFNRFTLPPDPELTIKTLKAAKGRGEFQVHVGCAKWGRKEWLGKICPPTNQGRQFFR